MAEIKDLGRLWGASRISESTGVPRTKCLPDYDHFPLVYMGEYRPRYMI